MPTHHYHRVFIRTQFLGRVLSVRQRVLSKLPRCAICRLKQGEGKCCRDAGREVVSPRGGSLEAHSLACPSLRACPGPCTAPLRDSGFLHSLQPWAGCWHKYPCLFLSWAPGSFSPGLQCCWGPGDMILGGPDSASPFLGLTLSAPQAGKWPFEL